MEFETRLLTAEEYNTLDAINYSTLSQMRKDPKNLTLTEEQKRLNFVTNPAMKLGALGDCMLFSSDAIDTTYYFSVASEPGEKMGELLTNYLASGGRPVVAIDDLTGNNLDILTASRDTVGFQTRWGMPAIAKNFIETCGPFFQDLINAEQRVIISPPLKVRADKAVTSLQTSIYFGISDIVKGETGLINTREFTFDGIAGDWNVLYQTGITFPFLLSTTEQVQCKGKTDIILINKEEKVVYVIDLKITGNPPREFGFKWLGMNYHIQAAMYVEAVQNWFIQMGFNNYEIRFKFLVANPDFSPVFWNMTPAMLTFARNGGTLYNGSYIPGLVDLIRQYQWHKEKQIYDYTPEEFAMKNDLTLRIV